MEALGILLMAFALVLFLLSFFATRITTVNLSSLVRAGTLGKDFYQWRREQVQQERSNWELPLHEASPLSSHSEEFLRLLSQPVAPYLGLIYYQLSIPSN